MLRHDGHRSAPAVRALAGQHFIEHDAQAVQIGARVHPVPLRLLGTDVVGRPQNLPGAGCAGVFHRTTRQTEIDQHRRVVLAQHHVGGLQVSMQNPEHVNHAKGFGDAAKVVQTFVDAQRIPQPIAKVAAWDVFHGEILIVRQGPEIVNLGDGAVRDARDDFVFALEALCVIQFARRRAAVHDLEHDIAPQPLAACKEYR